MEPRINYATVGGDGIAAVQAIERYLSKSSLEPALRELVKLRASQINGWVSPSRPWGRAS